jgi:chaperonin cofactor prefoldin
MDQGQF